MNPLSVIWIDVIYPLYIYSSLFYIYLPSFISFKFLMALYLEISAIASSLNSFGSEFENFVIFFAKCYCTFYSFKIRFDFLYYTSIYIISVKDFFLYIFGYCFLLVSSYLFFSKEMNYLIAFFIFIFIYWINYLIYIIF